MRIEMLRFSWVLALWVAPFLPAIRLPAASEPDVRPEIGQPVAIVDNSYAPEYDGCGGVLAALVNAGYEQQVVELVNVVRADNGLPPLKRVEQLIQAARYHAADMAQDEYFDHNSYDRVDNQLTEICSWDDRIESFYVPAGGPSWNSLAENIAAGYSTPESVMDGWMNSSGHRANILSSGNWEIGAGYYQGGPYRNYWVQDFGRRSGIYPLVINLEAASTATRAVSLYIYGSNTFTEMRLRNDEDSWGEWQAFKSSLDWELNCEVGEHSVSAELRNVTQTVSSSDTIELSQSDCDPSLGNLPETLNFSYSIADQVLLPAQWQLQPLNTGSSQTLTWTLSTQGEWFSVQPQSGTTPGKITVTADNFDAQTPGTSSGTITVTVTDPSGVTGSPYVIDLRLQIYPGPVQHAFLPQVRR